MKANYEKLKSKYDELKINPIIKEKIIYKENDKHIKELHEKSEKLHKKFWEKIEIIEELNKELKDVKKKLGSVENWKLRNYGMVFKVKSKEYKLINFGFDSGS